MISSTTTSTPSPLAPGASKTVVPASASAASATKVQQNALLALSTLKQLASQSRHNTAAKDAAMQKLPLLKAQLKNLMMFGGDPKTLAREAARLAKQIGDAAKEYARSGGNPAEAAAATPATASVVAAASPPAYASSAGAVASSRGDAASGTVAASGSSGQSAASSSKSADQTFVTEARLLARRANAVIQSALQEARRQKKTIGETGSEGTKALAAVEDAAFKLGLGNGLGLDSSVGYRAGAQSLLMPAAPVVAVTA